MKVNDPNIIVQSSGLKEIPISKEGIIKIELKNKTTLEFIPIINEDNTVSYEMEYLTDKENKKIEKLKEKITQLQNEILDIKEENKQGESLQNFEEI